MDRNTHLADSLKDMLQIARLAPSVHNSQPWNVKLQDNELQISIDKQHALREGDPTGRQTYISLGIFYEALLLAAAKFNIQLTNFRIDDQVLKAKMVPRTDKTAHSTLVELLEIRCSDRSIYQPVRVSEKDIRVIEHCASSSNVAISVLTDDQQIAEIANLTSKGIGLALHNPSFREELAHYLVLPWTSKERGISVKSLYINPLLEISQPFFLTHGISLKKEADLENKRWKSASGVVLLLGDGDIKDYWVEVGRTYLTTSLTLTKLGYSQATSAAIVEASTYHEDVEKMLHTKKRVLAVIRIGKGSAKKYYSPRVPVHDLLTLS